jgi:Fungal domain of unknown function (DUF1746)
LSFCIPLLSRVLSLFRAHTSNSSFRLLIRFIFQVNILSPKSPLSAFASVDIPVRRAVLILLGTFVLGFIPHLLFALPSAGEPTQYYLHGGLLIDFIGQRMCSCESFDVGGPISRLRLLSVDLIILGLQLVMLAIGCSGSSDLSPGNGNARGGSAELDRAERGETGDEEEEEGMVTNDAGYEHVTVRVGVVETIRSLWNNDTPVVRRMREV